ncbi:MAG: flavodoxin family protein [Deltaproteobacteria bacterium]|nr:flavodoxin family protein [Deltaproteobacteria bacterium]MBW2137546.1 flavodoxin family protein [Deltaproteobacteria bacterium]
MKADNFQKNLISRHGPPRAKVMGIGGSPRKNGNSDVLLRQVLKGVSQAKLPVSSVHLRELQFQPCIGCERCRKDKICTGLKDGMSIIYPEILESRGMVLVSPTHNYNVTAWIKAFIDRLYCFYEFDDNRPRGWSSRLAGQNRRAVLVAICEQEVKEDMGYTLGAMRRPLKALGYDIIGELPVYGIFDRGKAREKREVLAEAFRLGKELAGSLTS